jgi:hypothetical protein
MSLAPNKYHHSLFFHSIRTWWIVLCSQKGRNCLEMVFFFFSRWFFVARFWWSLAQYIYYKIAFTFQGLMIIYTRHFHEIAFSFQGLVIIYTRHFHEIAFSFQGLVIIYTRHFHEIALSFQGLVIIYTRHFHEIDFCLIFNIIYTR